VPAFFIILYSMEWGKDRSNAWLATMMLSFFQSVLVVDPVKVFIITAIITCILRKPDEDEDLIDCGDPFYNAIARKDEEFLNAKVNLEYLKDAKKSRRKKVSSLKFIDPTELSSIRQYRIKEIKMAEILREIASYFCFVIVLFFLCHQSRHTNSYLMYGNMKSSFIDHPAKPFEEVRRIVRKKKRHPYTDDNKSLLFSDQVQARRLGLFERRISAEFILTKLV
jgi:hypothetical protein